MGYCERVHPDAAADLATCFVERCLAFCSNGGSTALVTPQNWLFLGTYKRLRRRLLTDISWDMVARLGSGAFETISGEVVNVTLLMHTRGGPLETRAIAGLNVAALDTPAEKAMGLRKSSTSLVLQVRQLDNPDCGISSEQVDYSQPLARVVNSLAGIVNGDTIRFGRSFWEVAILGADWEFCQTTVESTEPYGGRSLIIFWEQERGEMYELARSVRHLNHVAQNWLRGKPNWGKLGVAVSQMGDLPATIYLGDRYDSNCCAMIPHDQAILPAIWAYCSSPEYQRAVRRLDQKPNVTNATLAKVPFDLAHWQKVAAEKYPHGLPKPFSSDPTQWLFNGHPKGSDQPLHVAVARLLGYQWPRQTGSSFPDCPALDPDGLEKLADDDGIVCLSATKGEAARCRASARTPGARLGQIGRSVL